MGQLSGSSCAGLSETGEYKPCTDTVLSIQSSVFIPPCELRNLAAERCQTTNLRCRMILPAQTLVSPGDRIWRKGTTKFLCCHLAVDISRLRCRASNCLLLQGPGDRIWRKGTTKFLCCHLAVDISRLRCRASNCTRKPPVSMRGSAVSMRGSVPMRIHAI